MYTKLFTCLLVVCLMGGLLNTSYSSDRYKSYKLVTNGDAWRGDTGPIVYGPPAPISNHDQSFPTEVHSFDNMVITLTDVGTDAQSIYDLQSNGVIRYIAQNPANPNQIHAVFMVSTDVAFADRNVRYFYTTNGGTSWDYLLTVNTTRSGFPVLTKTSDNRA